MFLTSTDLKKSDFDLNGNIVSGSKCNGSLEFTSTERASLTGALNVNDTLSTNHSAEGWHRINFCISSLELMFHGN